MLTIEEKRDWILENCLDADGDVDLVGLDFSEFDGDVYISSMKTRCNLYQDCHVVEGNLYQSEQTVGGVLHQGNSNVKWDIHQDYQTVGDRLFQNHHTVEGDLFQSYQTVEGDLFQSGHKKFTTLISYKPKVNEEVSDREESLSITKKAKKLTLEELETILGYKIEIVE